jgi:hypothetical protein
MSPARDDETPPASDRVRVRRGDGRRADRLALEGGGCGPPRRVPAKLPSKSGQIWPEIDTSSAEPAIAALAGRAVW